LLRQYEAVATLRHTNDDELDIHIDAAQARRLLCAYDGIVPIFWDVARNHNDEDVLRSLLALSIILNHHWLIGIFRNTRRDFTGQISRVSDFSDDGKSFSNTKNNLFELMFTTRTSSEGFDYDFLDIVCNENVGPLAKQLFWEIAKAAGWDEQNDGGIDDAIQQPVFREVLGLDQVAFGLWIQGLVPPPQDDEVLADDDPDNGFQFTPGHNPRPEKRAKRRQSMGGSMEKKHNQIQNSLWRELADAFGENSVSTEQPIGFGRLAVDVALENGDGTYTFIEIKTSRSPRACIREAMGQLFEYAHWPNATRATKLIIVGPNPSSTSSDDYVKLLRETYDLPIHYCSSDQVIAQVSD